MHFMASKPLGVGSIYGWEMGGGEKDVEATLSFIDHFKQRHGAFYFLIQWCHISVLARPYVDVTHIQHVLVFFRGNKI